MIKPGLMHNDAIHALLITEKAKSGMARVPA